MHVDEHFPQFLELAHGSGRIVDERPASARWQKFPSHNRFFGEIVQSIAFEKRPQIIVANVENRLYDHFLFAVFHRLAVGAASEKQRQSPYNY